MSLLDSGETNDSGYEQWCAGMAERVAARRERLGKVATKQELQPALKNPQKIIDDMLHGNRTDMIEEASNHISQADDFLARLDEVLTTST